MSGESNSEPLKESSVNPDLAVDYYLTNFLSLVNFVHDHYHPLLQPQELDFYRGFIQLSGNAQMLYVRLLLRKSRVFRREKLHYSEISSIDAAVEELCTAALAEVNPDEPVVDAVRAFTKPEWINFFNKEEFAQLIQSQESDAKKLSREALDSWLQDCPQQELWQLVYAERFTLIQLRCDECFNTFKLLFFGNLYQDMTDFVLRDLGLYQYEKYPITPEYAALQSREQVDQHLRYYQFVEQLSALDMQDSVQLLNFYDRLTLSVSAVDNVLQRRLHRVCLKIARQLERLQVYETALALYRQVELRPPSRERQVRILVTQQRYEEALCLSERIVQHPLAIEEQVFVESFVPRLLKKLRSGEVLESVLDDWYHDFPLSFALKTASPYKPPTDHVQLPPAHCSVEMAVVEYLSDQGACYYVENALVNSIFGLVIWEVLFAPVAGAFFNPFQTGPADLYEDFVSHRAKLFDELWRKANDQASLRCLVLENYDKKQGILNAFVYWGALSVDLIEMAMERIPYGHWRLMFDHLLQDLRNHRSGLPDLVFFPDAGGYEFLEVKGPGDKLQPNQRQWMKFFKRHQISHRVVNVTWDSTSDT